MGCELRMLSLMPLLDARTPKQAPCGKQILPPPTSHVYSASDAGPLGNTVSDRENLRQHGYVQQLHV